MKLKSNIPALVASVAATAVLMGIGVGLVVGQAVFNDVPDSDPRIEDIQHAASQGWFQGYPDGSFRPDQQISEDQLARVIRRARPGLNRGDAAVFIRGGVNRLEATVTATTTTAAATTTTVRTGEPGGEGPADPGGGGPVDPNPPVVIEPTTTTTAPSEPAATTTTTEPAAADSPTLVYGGESGWMDSKGIKGSIAWFEFRNWGSAAQTARLTTNWGGTVEVNDGVAFNEPEGYRPYVFVIDVDQKRYSLGRSHADEVIPRFRFTGAECDIACTAMESSSSIPAGIRQQLASDGFHRTAGSG